MRFRLEVRLTSEDLGQRVVVRWRRPAGDHSDEVADVLGTLVAVDADSFSIRKASGALVIVPRERALAGKTIPAPPRRSRRATPGP